MSIAAFLAFLLQAAIAAWAKFGFAEVESIIAAHTVAFAAGEGLYTDLNRYPFIVSCYGPLLYLFEALGIKAGINPLMAGRLLSVTAFGGVIWLTYRMLRRVCESPYAAWAGALLAASTANLLVWGTAGRADMLALLFSVAALDRYTAYREQRRVSTLIACAVLIAAAIFTKQTYVAAGATISIFLLIHERGRGLRFVTGLGAAGVATAALVNWATDGGYLANAITANLNPFQMSNLTEQLRYFSLTAAPLCVLAAAGIAARRGKAVHEFAVYLGFAVVIFLVTAPKIGSDLNYQIETVVALSLCAGLALDRLRFFPLLFAEDRSWVTLLQAPLLLHIIFNCAVTGKTSLERVGREIARQAQYAQLAPYVAGPGRMVSVDTDFLMASGHAMEIEPFIYHRLVDAGIVGAQPVLEDLAAGRFSNILLYEDLGAANRPHLPLGAPSLPDQHLEIIRRRYEKILHAPGPLLGGVYLYQPKGAAASLWPHAVDHAREGDSLANVLDARDPGDAAFDAHAESAVRNGAVLAEIEKPVEGLAR